jgi:predicted transcriptional regulator
MSQRIKPPLPAARAKYLLAQAGATQTELAELCAVTPAAVSNTLNGWSYSRRIWEKFFEITGARPTRKAS